MSVSPPAAVAPSRGAAAEPGGGDVAGGDVAGGDVAAAAARRRGGAAARDAAAGLANLRGQDGRRVGGDARRAMSESESDLSDLDGLL